MLVFSLGTLPALASIGILTSFSKGSVQKHLTTIAALLVIILGIAAIPSGIALTNPGLGSLSVASAQGSTDQRVPIIDGVQTVEMKVVGLEYIPSRFTVTKGVPVKFVIDGTQAAGCAQIVTLPSMNIRQNLPKLGTKTIEFTPTETGNIPVQCSMAMTTPGAGFTVIEQLDGSDQSV